MSRYDVVWTAVDRGRTYPSEPPLPPAGWFRNAFGIPFVRVAPEPGAGSDPGAGSGGEPPRILLSLQVREDGALGNWGGGVEEGESYADGLRRELAEEAGDDGSEWHLLLVVAYYHRRAREMDYVYVKQLPTPAALVAWEHRVLDAPEYGKETLGLRRLSVPANRGAPTAGRKLRDATFDTPDRWLPVAHAVTRGAVACLASA